MIAVQEQSCQVWDAGELTVHRFAPMFPSPRVERVSPGHLVAIASSPSGADAVVWRWYDAVVLGTVVPESADGGSVRLWEPAHGEGHCSGPRDLRTTAPRDAGLGVRRPAGCRVVG